MPNERRKSDLNPTLRINSKNVHFEFIRSVGGDRIPKKPDLNRLFEERTIRVGGDRRGAKQTGFKPQP